MKKYTKGLITLSLILGFSLTSVPTYAGKAPFNFNLVMSVNEGSENSVSEIKSDNEGYSAATVVKTDYVEGDLLYFRTITYDYDAVTPWVQSYGSGTTNMQYYVWSNGIPSYAQWQSYRLRGDSDRYNISVSGNWEP